MTPITIEMTIHCDSEMLRKKPFGGGTTDASAAIAGV